MTDSTIDDLIKGLPLQERVPAVALRKLLDDREKVDAEQEKQIIQIKKKYR